MRDGDRDAVTAVGDRSGSSLTGLVADGLGGARLLFGRSGADGRDRMAAGRLAETGAASFTDAGSQPVLAVALTNDRASVELLLGAIMAGATLVSLPLPARGADLGVYVDFLRQICEGYGAREIVARDDIAELAHGVGLSARGHGTLGAAPLATPNREASFRLIQLSSGSTQQPKPVELDDNQLGANVAALLDTLEPQPGDVAVSWLPLSHDMGLVGMLLTSIAAMGPRWVGSGDVVLLDPADFLRRPSVWPEALSAHRGTFTAAPDFGYHMATRRPPGGDLDLSAVRCAIVGGEIVRVTTLEQFTDRFAASGFDPVALCPAYGLAELGLAASMTPPQEPWRHTRIATSALADGRLDPPRRDQPSVALVASGRPLAGYEVRTGGDADRTGRIAVRGPSVGTNGATGAAFADADGWLHTGDSGFLRNGWLTVCGRTDDYLVTHSRNLYAPAIETEIGQLDGIRSGRAAAIALPTGDWVVVAEASHRHETRRQLAEDIRRAAVKAAAGQPRRHPHRQTRHPATHPQRQAPASSASSPAAPGRAGHASIPQRRQGWVVNDETGHLAEGGREAAATPAIRSFAACARALTDPSLTSDPHACGLVTQPTGNLLFMGGEQHQALRRIVAPYFTPSAVERLRPVLAVRRDQLVEDLLRRTRADLVADLAEPLVLSAIFETLGIRQRQRPGLAELLRSMLGMLESDPAAGTHDPPGMSRLALAGVRAMVLLQRDLARGTASGVLAALAEAARRDDLSDYQVVATPVVLLYGGYENPLNYLTCLIGWAVEHPKTFRDVATARPEILVDEVLRYGSPTRGVVRWAAHDTAIDGLRLRRGQTVWIDLDAANHDADHFSDPHRVCPSTRRRHLGLGNGSHACPGGSLARLEALLVTDALLRLPRGVLESADVEWHEATVARGASAVHIQLPPRRRRRPLTGARHDQRGGAGRCLT